MKYEELLSQTTDASFETFMQIASQILPEEKKRAPWLGLSHGVKLLENDVELAQYMCAYGNMHKEKIDMALDAVKDVSIFSKHKITIIDWGCGQALATICFFDYLHRQGQIPNINEIILIEPSKCALNRAALNLSKYINPHKLRSVNKFINDVTSADIDTTGGMVLHFFSNILDISTVDVRHLFGIIDATINLEQLFFCVSPQNLGSSKIYEFAKFFDLSDADMVKEYSGKLIERGTISMLVFHRKGKKSDIVKVEFSRQYCAENELNLLLRNIIDEIEPTDTLEKNVLLFYQTAIEVERAKSAKVLDYYLYPMCIDADTDCIKFNIDIQDNSDFENEFKKNFDNKITKWPRNLNISIGIILNDKFYSILQYVYPHEFLRDFDISENFISVALSSFSFNSDIADVLEISADVIEVIETVMKDSSLENLEMILKDAISNDVVIDHQLRLALTSEDVAFSQIDSELKSLQREKFSNLLNDFLKGYIGNNNSGNLIDPDVLLHIVDMDESQRNAIATALNSRVSVITGPPGCGKTQMILNLMVNALIEGKKVLVASKNNKAVDNIKERFDLAEPDYNYFLRFGSREAIKDKLIPYLDDLLVKIPNIRADRASFRKSLKHYLKLRNIIVNGHKRINEYISICEKQSNCEVKLNRVVLETKKSTQRYKNKINNLDELYAAIIPFVESSYADLKDWRNWKEFFMLEIKKMRQKNYGIRKMIFLLFQKRQAIKRINRIISIMPEEFTDFVNEETAYENSLKSKGVDGIIDACCRIFTYIEQIVNYNCKLTQIESEYKANLKKARRVINTYNRLIEKLEEQLVILKRVYAPIPDAISNAKIEIASIGKSLFKGYIEGCLTSSNSTNYIARYKNYLPGQLCKEDEELNIYEEDAMHFLKVLRLNTVTSLSVKNAYPLQNEIFDMVIVDEASQCDIASALPLIQRTKQLVVVGDPMQLRHITSVNHGDELVIKNKLSIGENPFVHYVEKSLWDYCAELITTSPSLNHPVVLDCHYRCMPAIIGYSNEFFYRRRLGINLSVCTKESHSDLIPKGLIWVDVKGEQKSDSQNVNMAEVEESVKIAEDMARKYPEVSIGIISPFKDQAQEINAKLSDEFDKRIVSDTVHKFQGDEKDVIIYSLVVTDNSPDSKMRWIDCSMPNIVNVAITRARSALYIVGNKDYVKRKSTINLPLGFLANYADRKIGVEPKDNTVTYVIDTNVFISCPDIIENISSSDNIVISAKVVDELDKLKVVLCDKERCNAERALRNINNKLKLSKIRIECADLHYLPIDFSGKNPDNQILSVALKYKNQNCVLLTSDNGLLIKAKCLGIKTDTLKSFLTKTV